MEVLEMKNIKVNKKVKKLLESKKDLRDPRVISFEKKENFFFRLETIALLAFLYYNIILDIKELTFVLNLILFFLCIGFLGFCIFKINRIELSKKLKAKKILKRLLKSFKYTIKEESEFLLRGSKNKIEIMATVESAYIFVEIPLLKLENKFKSTDLDNPKKGFMFTLFGLNKLGERNFL